MKAKTASKPKLVTKKATEKAKVDKAGSSKSSSSEESGKEISPSDSSKYEASASQSKSLSLNRPLSSVEQANKQTQVTKTEIIEEKGDRKYVCQTCGEVFAHG